MNRKGKNYCRACAPGKPSGFRSPTFSMLLSLIPGLGQFYAGSFVKGLAFLLGAGACVALHEQVPVVAPLALWFLAAWDARMSAFKRNYKLTEGRSGTPGAGEGDWMLMAGTIGLGALYTVLPLKAGITIEPWALWSAFSVVLVLSALLGRGGSHVKKA
jgi:hypothetical protein